MQRVTKDAGQTPAVTLCYEAGYDGFWLARYEAGLADGVRLKVRRDHLAQALDLKSLNGPVSIKVLEAPSAAHPGDASLHLRGHEAPGYDGGQKIDAYK